jgi:hypothetical protein
MNPRRFATVATVLCETAFVAFVAGFGSVATEHIGAAPIADLRPSVPTADAPRSIVISNAAVENVEMTTVAESVPVADKAAADIATVAEPAMATDTPVVAEAPEATFKVASADPSEILPRATPAQAASVSTADSPAGTKQPESSVEIVDECLVLDICIDRYLWALYQRTPKEDSIKVDDERKVTVKRKGKTVTVTKTFTRLVDEDFAWKDPKAAGRAGMPMMEYVIRGMDRNFKEKLFYMLHAADEAGLSPGITSAFRDDYRQSIASGLKAATDRSYHGGSFRGGYGHGLAADVVSVKGATRAQRQASTDIFWKWIDLHEKEFGIGRPYLDRDPPHVASTDGREYASHRGAPTLHAGSDVKKHTHHAQRYDRKAAKRIARSSKVRAS